MKEFFIKNCLISSLAIFMSVPSFASDARGGIADERVRYCEFAKEIVELKVTSEVVLKRLSEEQKVYYRYCSKTGQVKNIPGVPGAQNEVITFLGSLNSWDEIKKIFSLNFKEATRYRSEISVQITSAMGTWVTLRNEMQNGTSQFALALLQDKGEKTYGEILRELSLTAKNLNSQARAEQ